MIEDRYVELINKEIDGTNSPGESAKLRRHLQAYPGADNYFRQLTSVYKALDKLPEAVPPPDLRKNVLNAIQEGADECGSTNRREARHLLKSRVDTFLRLRRCF